MRFIQLSRSAFRAFDFRMKLEAKGRRKGANSRQTPRYARSCAACVVNIRVLTTQIGFVIKAVITPACGFRISNADTHGEEGKTDRMLRTRGGAALHSVWRPCPAPSEL